MWCVRLKSFTERVGVDPADFQLEPPVLTAHTHLIHTIKAPKEIRTKCTTIKAPKHIARHAKEKETWREKRKAETRSPVEFIASSTATERWVESCPGSVYLMMASQLQR
jgi:hypothetical protein